MSLCILACLMPTDCPRQRIEACPSRSGEAVTLPGQVTLEEVADEWTP